MNFEKLTPNPVKPGKMMIVENIHNTFIEYHI